MEAKCFNCSRFPARERPDGWQTGCPVSWLDREKRVLMRCALLFHVCPLLFSACRFSWLCGCLSYKRLGVWLQMYKMTVSELESWIGLEFYQAFFGMKGNVKESVLMSLFGTSLVPHSHQQREALAKGMENGTRESKRRTIIPKLKAEAVLK